MSTPILASLGGSTDYPPVMTAAGVRSLEQFVLARGHGLHEATLMESVAAHMALRTAKLLLRPAAPRHLVLLAGPGNNGGDALALARLLKGQHAGVWDKLKSRTFILWPGARANTLRATQENLLREALSEGEVDFFSVGPRHADAMVGLRSAKGRALLLDGLFGSGFKARPLEAGAAAWLAEFETVIEARRFFRVALDVPSGLQDNGKIDKAFKSLRADVTLCVGAPKLSQIQDEGVNASGQLLRVELVMPAQKAPLNFPGERIFNFRRPRLRGVVAALEGADTSLVRAQAADHKNSRGRVLLVGGSLVKGGALALSARAALHCGVGYATVVEPTWTTEGAHLDYRERVAAAGEWVSAPFPSSAESWIKLFADHGSVVFGCGLAADGFSAEEQKTWAPFFAGLGEWLIEAATPGILVADGGGLRAVARWLLGRGGAGGSLARPIIFTPHPKEAAGLLQLLAPSHSAASRAEVFYELRARLSALGIFGALLLKGAYPITSALGESGPADAWDLVAPALATAGSGDVLSGALAALSLRLKTKASGEGAALAALQLGVATQFESLRHLRSGATASDIAAAMGAALGEFFEK